MVVLTLVWLELSFIRAISRLTMLKNPFSPSLSAAILNLEQKVPLSSLPFLLKEEEEGGSSGGRKRESSIKCATPLKIAHIDENYERTSMAALPPPLPISNHLRSSGPNFLIHIIQVYNGTATQVGLC